MLSKRRKGSLETHEPNITFQNVSYKTTYVSRGLRIGGLRSSLVDLSLTMRTDA